MGNVFNNKMKVRIHSSIHSLFRKQAEDQWENQNATGALRWQVNSTFGECS